MLFPSNSTSCNQRQRLLWYVTTKLVSHQIGRSFKKGLYKIAHSTLCVEYYYIIYHFLHMLSWLFIACHFLSHISFVLLPFSSHNPSSVAFTWNRRERESGYNSCSAPLLTSRVLGLELDFHFFFFLTASIRPILYLPPNLIKHPLSFLPTIFPAIYWYEYYRGCSSILGNVPHLTKLQSCQQLPQSCTFQTMLFFKLALRMTPHFPRMNIIFFPTCSYSTSSTTLPIKLD